MTNKDAIKALRDVAAHLKANNSWGYQLTAEIRNIAKYIEDIESENPAAAESKYSD